MVPCLRRDEVWTPAFAEVTVSGLFTDSLLVDIRKINLYFHQKIR